MSGRQKGRGKVAIVTGGHKGVGKEVVRGLLKEGVRVYIACKNMVAGKEVHKELTAEFLELAEGTINYKECDLADFASIKKFAMEFRKDVRRQKLHLLILNAEVKWGPRRWTKQGIELQFGVNHIGHFMLGNLLLDMLKASAPSRIIVVSNVSLFYGQINFDDINSEKYYGPCFAHNQSKLANILYVKELSRRLQLEREASQEKPEGDGESEDPPEVKMVTANCVNPGIVAPGLKHDTKRLRTAPTAAEQILHVVFEPELDEVTGKYFSDLTETSTATALQADDMEAAAKLWESSEQYCQRTEADVPVVEVETPLVDVQLFSKLWTSGEDLISTKLPL